MFVMAACKKSIECLGDICACETEIPFEIEDGVYRMHVEFNGVLLTCEVEVADDLVELPSGWFNESYAYLIALYDNTGKLVNDTWYSLNVNPCKQCP